MVSKTSVAVVTRLLEDVREELVHSCGNCQREFENETAGIVEINLQSNARDDDNVLNTCFDGTRKHSLEDGDGDTENSITVLQALSRIYGYPLSNSRQDGLWRENDNCTLCETCAEISSNFYQAFLQLRRLANKASYISKGLNQLHESIATSFSSRQQPRSNKRQTSTSFVKGKDPSTNDDDKNTGTPDEVDEHGVGENYVPLEVKIETLQGVVQPLQNYHEGEDFTVVQLPPSKKRRIKEAAPILEEAVITGTTEVVSPNGKIIRTSTRTRKVRKLDYGEIMQHKPSVKGPKIKVKQENDIQVTNCKEPSKNNAVTGSPAEDSQTTYYNKANLKKLKDGRFRCPKTKCLKAFKGLKTLNKHVMEHLSPEISHDKSLIQNAKVADSESFSITANQTQINPDNSKKLQKKNNTMDKINNQPDSLEKQYHCEHCDKRFLLKKMYDRHLASHENQRAQCRCTVCDQTFPTALSLARHISCVHDVNESKMLDYSCPECPSSEKPFENYNDLKSHFESAHKEPFHFCTKCGKFFVTLGHLCCHYKNIHYMELPADIDDHNIATQEIQQLKYEPAELLEKSTSEPGERKRKDDDKIDKVFKCNQCNKEFKKRQQLNMHTLFHNDKEPRFGCSKCPKKFFQPNGLRKHMLIHTMENPLICKECDKVFERHDHFKRHVEMVHNQNKPKMKKKIDPRNDPDHTCKECHKTFSRKEYLSLHMRIHTGEKPHMCSVCGKLFRDPRNLAQHLVTHKTDRPFCCSVCGLTFKRAHHLNDHEGTHRQNVARPFVCSVSHCLKSFKLRKHLVSHELVHTGSKDHTCHVCGRAFSRKDNLRQHINKIHGKEYADDMQVIVDKQKEKFRQSQLQQNKVKTVINENSLILDQVTTSNADLITGNDQLSEVLHIIPSSDLVTTLSLPTPTNNSITQFTYPQI